MHSIVDFLHSNVGFFTLKCRTNALKRRATFITAQFLILNLMAITAQFLILMAITAQFLILMFITAQFLILMFITAQFLILMSYC
jgi:hypothetical protein